MPLQMAEDHLHLDAAEIGKIPRSEERDHHGKMTASKPARTGNCPPRERFAASYCGVPEIRDVIVISTGAKRSNCHPERSQSLP